MFEGPEYASYIALCRELRNHRVYRTGDYVFYERSGRVALLGEGEDADAANLGMEPKFWLPRLDQWLAMLEKEGHKDTYFERETNDWGCTWSPFADVDWGAGPTREEAAARLWMAVTRD